VICSNEGLFAAFPGIPEFLVDLGYIKHSVHVKCPVRLVFGATWIRRRVEKRDNVIDAAITALPLVQRLVEAVPFRGERILSGRPLGTLLRVQSWLRGSFLLAKQGHYTTGWGRGQTGDISDEKSPACLASFLKWKIADMLCDGREASQPGERQQSLSPSRRPVTKDKGAFGLSSNERALGGEETIMKEGMML
jgi:hypothetical protein